MEQLNDIETTMTVDEYINVCLEYNKEHEKDLNGVPPSECPINVFASENNTPCKSVISGIAECPICGNGMCPVCKSHSAEQISRVTGYMGTVGSWNNAKKQELKDRKRYDIPSR